MTLHGTSGIEIKLSDEVIKYHFATKKEYIENTFILKALKKYASKEKLNFKKITCLCQKNPPCYLSLKKVGDMYYLANFPNNPEHQPCCIFYKDKTENLTNNKGEYNIKIFQPHESSSINEKRRKCAFNNFCRDVIADASTHAFSLKNKQLESRGELQNPNYTNFIGALYVTLFKNAPIAKKGDKANIFETLRQIDLNLEFGIITDDEFLHCTKKKKYQNLEAKSHINKKEQQNFKYSILSEDAIDTKEYLTLFGYTIAPPYFFMAITKKNNWTYEGKTYFGKDIVRLFVHPIFYKKNQITFVESDAEREYAKELHDSKTPFIKPLSGNEFYRIKKQFATYTTRQNKNTYFNFSGHRPSFIEFYLDRVKITNIKSFNSEKYLLSFNSKSSYFKEEASRHNGFYEISS